MVWEGGARWRDDSENFYFSINRVKDGSCVSNFKIAWKAMWTRFIRFIQALSCIRGFVHFCLNNNYGYWNKHVDYKLRTNPKLQFVTKSKATVAIKCYKNVWDKYRDQTKIVITVKPIWKL